MSGEQLAGAVVPPGVASGSAKHWSLNMGKTASRRVGAVSLDELRPWRVVSGRLKHQAVSTARPFRSSTIAARTSCPSPSVNSDEIRVPRSWHGYPCARKLALAAIARLSGVPEYLGGIIFDDVPRRLEAPPRVLTTRPVTAGCNQSAARFSRLPLAVPCARPPCGSLSV